MKFAKYLIKSACAIVVTAAIVLPAHADFIALNSTRVVGNQGFTGALGMDFNVLAPIRVTKLGAYDSAANGFSNPIQVGIFDRATGLLVGASATLTTANTTVEGTGSNNRFDDIADFMLSIGSYSIVAVGFNSVDRNGNGGNGGSEPTIDTGGALIAFTGTARYHIGTALVFPTSADGGPSNRYDAGTFEFKEVAATAAAVPEPGTYAMLLAGLGLMGFMARRRKSS